MKADQALLHRAMAAPAPPSAALQPPRVLLQVAPPLVAAAEQQPASATQPVPGAPLQAIASLGGMQRKAFPYAQEQSHPRPNTNSSNRSLLETEAGARHTRHASRPASPESVRLLARPGQSLGVRFPAVAAGRVHSAERTYTCVHCAGRFGSRSERRAHIRTTHLKPFGCSGCASKFTRKFDLEKHFLTVHEKRRPFSCGACSLSFGQKHHLVRHEKAVHSKTRDFVCDGCDANFARKEHLANHKRSVHDKAKPFICFLCDADYCEKRALKRHLESVHAVKPTRSGVLAGWQAEAKEGPPPIAEILKL